MPSKTYRVGIIGCGWVSTGHMNGYKAAQSTEVVAAADVDPERLQRFSEEYGITNLYTDYREMLEKENLDIVSICTWPVLHCEMTVEAAKWNPKAILCEKPIALSISEANKMIEECDRNHCRLIVGHQRRFENRYVKAKELLDNGEIGGLLKVEVYGGDLFCDDHCVDILRFYAGDVPVRWVIGQVDWERRKYCPWRHNIEDAAIGYLKFENDVEGCVMAGRAIEGHLSYSVTLTGTEGIIQIAGGNYPAEHFVKVLNSKTLGWRTFEAEDELIGKPRKEILGRPTIEYYWINAWQLLMEAMIDSLESDKGSIVSGREAIKTLEIIATIYESSRLRTMIHFPLPPQVDEPLELMEKTHSAQFWSERKEIIL